MTFDPMPPSEPEPAPRRRLLGRVPRAALTAGLAVGLALGGAGIAFAATSSSSSTTTPKSTATTNPSTKAPHPGGRPFGPRGFGAFGGFGLGFGGPAGGKVIHASYTVQTGNGTYKTIEVQTGTVTSVSTNSITVKSADNYVHTYAVDASTVVNSQRDGIGSVTKTDQVQVEATPVSGKDTSTNIVDITKVGASRNGFGFGPPPGSGSSGSSSGSSGSSGSAKAGSASTGGFGGFGGFDGSGPGAPTGPVQPQ